MMMAEELKRCDVCAGLELEKLDAKTALCRCRSCGFVFRNPRPSFEEIAAFYSANDHYDGWLAVEKARDLLWQRRLAMVRRERTTGTLLDVGTGIAQFLFLAGHDFETEGTEVSPVAVRIAKERYGIGIRQGRIEDIDFGNKHFELITLFHVLEHVASPASTLARCRDLLAPTGIIIVAVPNELESWRRIVKGAFRRLRLGRFRRYGPYGLLPLQLDDSAKEIHLSHFTPRVLRLLLERTQLRVVREDLDPYYAAAGVRKVAKDAMYYFFSAVHRILGVNWYETVWMVATKSERSGRGSAYLRT
jgi:SAM-dependent methyltransferase